MPRTTVLTREQVLADRSRVIAVYAAFSISTSASRGFAENHWRILLELAGEDEATILIKMRGRGQQGRAYIGVLSWTKCGNLESHDFFLTNITERLGRRLLVKEVARSIYDLGRDRYRFALFGLGSRYWVFVKVYPLQGSLADAAIVTQSYVT